MTENRSVIGIATVGRSLLLSNYGSFFQHLALRDVLKGWGFVPFRIESDSWFKDLGDWLMPLRTLRMRILYCLGVVAHRSNVLGWRFLVGRLRVLLDYHKFIGRLFEPQNPASIVACISGGDQVWSACCPSAFLLDRADVPIRISYAASTGWADREHDAEWIDFVRRAGACYRAFGLREQVGVEVCKRIVTGIDIKRVADPVFLKSCSEWMDIADRGVAFDRPTLLAYMVNVDAEEDLHLLSLHKVAEDLGCQLKVIGIQGAQYYLSGSERLEVSPSEFLACYRDAKYVVTNSFHGLVFAFVFGKRFAFIRQHLAAYGDQNARQQELLARYGLLDRALPQSLVASDLLKVLVQEFDFGTVAKIVAEEREMSLRWLRKHLNVRSADE